MDEYSDSPYAWDWSAGAFAPPGVIWLGEIPLPRARELVAEGWDVVGAPLPPEPPGPVTAAAPPAETPPSDEGGPEEAAPPDFDIPLPSEPPPASLPTPVQPPLEGEIVGPDIVYHDYEGYDQLPGFGEYPTPPKRIIEGELDIPGPRESAPPFLWPLVKGAGRVLGGPFGAALPSIIEAGMPEVLGSGTLPFPPIPKVNIPTPDVAVNFPDYPPLPAPEVPQLSIPAPPDVVIATPTAPLPQPTAPRQRAPAPSGASYKYLFPALGALAPILRPIHRRRGQPRQGIEQIFQTSPEANPFTPLPSARVSEETLPRGVTIPSTLESPQDLTAPLGTPVPLPGTFGPLQFLTPTATTEDDNRCKCKKNEKHEPDPSDIVANVKVYKRRMSNWSLKNLNRGSKAANALRRFL